MASSVSLGPRALWLFGDTLRGELRAQRRVWQTMPRNSVAIVTGATPPSARVRYAMRFNASVPADPHRGFFSPADAAHWFWLVSPIALSADAMVLLGWEMRATTERGPFAFATVRSVALRVNCSAASPFAWSHSVHALPSANASTLVWGAAAAVHAQFLYVLGAQTLAGGQQRAVMARVAERDVARNAWHALEALCDDGQWRSPALAALSLRAVSPAVAPEATLTFVPPIARWVYFMVPFGSTTLHMLSSRNITGPYEQQPVFELPPPFNDFPRVFCYAAKVHTELSDLDNGRLFVTLMSNTQNIKDLEQMLDVYVPLPLHVNVSSAA